MYNLLNNETLKKYAPNEIGCVDFSIIKIKNEHYHLFTIIDPITTKVLFYEFNKHQTADIVLRGIKSCKNLKIFHSDHGSQFTQQDIRNYLAMNNIKQSMGRIGKSLDNRPVEFFFGLIKYEWLFPFGFANKTFIDVKNEIDWYIDFYNNSRINSKFMMSPLNYEKSMLKQKSILLKGYNVNT